MDKMKTGDIVEALTCFVIFVASVVYFDVVLFMGDFNPTLAVMAIAATILMKAERIRHEVVK